MSVDVQKSIADGFALISAAHHLALAVILAILWIRRRSIERTLGVYFAAAFATSAAALSSRPESRPLSILAIVVCSLWVLYVRRREEAMGFRRTPRLRLWLMAAAGLVAFTYPVPGEASAGIRSPLGVLLPPTVLLGLAFLNSTYPNVGRALHWTLSATGVFLSIIALASDANYAHVVLLCVSVYGALLLLGAGREIEEVEDSPVGTVREIRDRMYRRRTLLPGPRKPRPRTRTRIGGRGRLR
jgi:hypothetical protein